MGNLTLAKEESRDMWSFLALERLCQDLRYAVRMLGKNPGFTAVAAVSLALGIGGNAAVFSLVNTLLIKPLPYFEPNQLARITDYYPKAALVAFQQQSRTMDIASVSPGSEMNLTGEGEPVRVVGSITSANLFSVLGAPVERGRSFEPGEDRPGRDGVVILSHALWRNKFDGDPQILGRMITLDGMNRQIVGIMPAPFSFPSSQVELWMPTRLDPSNTEDFWGSEFVPLIGRLHPGATLAQAQSEIRPLVKQLRRMFPFPMPHDWNADATAISLQADMVQDVRGKLLVLFSAVGIVLLIACANIAGLLLARATTRHKEIALRAALGASRRRIVRQLLTESVLLSLTGGALGILLGAATLSVFKSVLPAGTSGLASVRIDGPVLGCMTALTLLTGLVFGIAPALSALRVDLTSSIKTGSQRSMASTWPLLRNWLIAGEVALTAVLVVGAGLLIRSLYVLSQVNPGFQTQQILRIHISPNESRCQQPAACIALYDDLVQRARGISGVSDAAVANTIPMDGELPTIPADVEGHPKTPDYPAPMLWAGAISPDYLRIMRIPLLAGRAFTQADGAHSPGVVLVTASTARHFWPGQSAIGKHIKPVWDKQWRTVVGVAADVRQYDLTNKAPDWVPGGIYMPYPQSVQGDRQLPAAMNLLVKISADPARAAVEVRQLAVQQSPDAPISEVQSMQEVVSASITDFRAIMGVFISFAIAAIVLAGVGIYGLVSYSVAQRKYEIGVRIAIGASKRTILELILAQSLKVTLVRLGAGILAALLLTRFLSSLLFGVAATDAMTFAGVTGLLFGIAVLASCIPAWRAVQIDPVKSLRLE